MSIGHHPDEPEYTPDMRKSEENITEKDREEAMRRIEGSLNTPSDGQTQTQSIDQ